MALQSSFYNTDGTTRTYPSTKHIATKQHVSVYGKRVSDSTWVILAVDLYELVNNSIVFDTAPDTVIYSQIEVRVADTAIELEDSPSDIATVAGIAANVSTVAGNTTNINTVATNIGAVQTVSGTIANVNTVATNVANVNTVATNITSVNTVATNIADVISVAGTIVPNIAEILLADTNATTATTQAGIATTKAGEASTSATNAQLSAWEAEAEKMTADSYATEAEDVLVKVYTSNGDGTFTVTPTTEYSALHWAAKSTLAAQGDAVNISYDNATSGLTATNVQTAIDEVEGRLDTVESTKAPLASPAFTDTPTAPTPSAGDSSTKLATTAFANSLIAQFEVTGSAVTSIDFSGLDINTHKSYRIEVELVNATASNAVLYAYVNGDTVSTNYYSQFLTGAGASVTAALGNTPNIADFTASQISSHSLLVMRAGAGRVSIYSRGERQATTAPILQNYLVNKIATVTNITQLTFTASVASSIGVGSKIRIYRGDV